MTSSSGETGHVTGTKDKDYNVIWFTEVCLSNVLRLQTYVQDAERDGDSELADFFRKAQAESKKGAEAGKQLLKSRLAGLSPAPAGPAAFGGARPTSRPRSPDGSREPPGGLAGGVGPHYPASPHSDQQMIMDRLSGPWHHRRGDLPRRPPRRAPAHRLGARLQRCVLRRALTHRSLGAAVAAPRSGSASPRPVAAVRGRRRKKRFRALPHPL